MIFGIIFSKTHSTVGQQPLRNAHSICFHVVTSTIKNRNDGKRETKCLRLLGNGSKRVIRNNFIA